MSIAVARQGAGSSINSEFGTFPRTDTLWVTGLSAGAANSIPHGLTSPTGAAIAPSVVIPFSIANAGSGNPVPVSLDLTNGGNVGTGVGPGFDSTNIYVVTGAGVTTAGLRISY